MLLRSERFFEQKLWSPLEGLLTYYTDRISLSSKMGAELWVLLRFIMLLIALMINEQICNNDNLLLIIFAFIISAYIILDILAVNTKIVFISKQPEKLIRSIILLFLSLIRICICWSIYYYAFGQSFSPNLSKFDAVYFSFVTLTTLGYGDISPIRGDITPKLLIIIELIVGLYFLTVIIATVVSWGINYNLEKDSSQTKEN